MVHMVVDQENKLTCLLLRESEYLLTFSSEECQTKSFRVTLLYYATLKFEI